MKPYPRNSYSSKLQFALAGAFAFLVAIAPMTRASDADEIKLLREQIQMLDQKLRALERKLEIKNAESAEAAGKTVVATADASGFSIGSADKSFKLNFRVLAQVDGRFFFNDKNIPGTTTSIAQDTFLLRRIRPIFAGTLSNFSEFAVVPEFAGGDATASSVVLQDAWISFKLNSALKLKAGKFTSPVALEPGTNRHFIESPFVNTLLPNRDIGVELFGSLNSTADYRIGVYNGIRNNTACFARDPNSDKTIAGRIAITPFKNTSGPFKVLTLAIGASSGRDKGAVGTALQNPVTNTQQTLLNFGSLQADGRHTRISPATFIYSGPFSFVGEYAWEKQELSLLGSPKFDATNTAWRATADYVLTGEDATQRGVVPRSDFALNGNGWGAFEIAARVSSISFDDVLFAPLQGNLPNIATNANATGATAYGIGLNWYLTRNLALFFNYEYTRFEGNTRRPSESAFFSRAQVNF